MAVSYKNAFGFQVTWEVDPANIGPEQNLNTEIKTIEGMNGVKWQLKLTCANDACIIDLLLQSDDEITYLTCLHHYLQPEHYLTQNGKMTGERIINLETIKMPMLPTFLNNNNQFVISVDGYCSYTKKNPDITDKMAEWGLRLRQSPTDFEILVDGQVIPIHKNVVAAESPVFARMFESNFKEANENKVEITNASYETIQAAIEHCYHQDLSPHLQELEKVVDLLYFSDKYDFQTLKPLLETHISTNFMQKENISLIVSTADKTNSLQLRQACVSFICGLLNQNNGEFSHEEIIAFDPKFTADVLFQALNSSKKSA